MQVVVCAICSVTLLCFLTNRDQERAKHGFFGVRIDDDAEAFKDDGGGLCEWKPTTAWMQLLPFRQNFFVVGVMELGLGCD